MCSAAGYISDITKSMNELFSTQIRVCISLVGPSETGLSQLIYSWLKMGTFQTKIDKDYFFDQHSQTPHDVMQKKIDKLEVVRGVNFEFINSLKTTVQLTCYFLTNQLKQTAIKERLLTTLLLEDTMY